MTDPHVIGKGIYDAVNIIKKHYCENDEEKLIKALDETYIKMFISVKSHLMRYISSTLLPGSGKIKDMPYFVLIKGSDDN